VSDRFGDYGIVGVLISKNLSDSLDVDTFLLSCRVLGRGVEHAMLSRLGRLARESNLARVDLHFTPSPKNKPALSFLENVASEFKQPGSGELLFRLPAGLAQDIAFNPAAVSQPEQAVRNNGKMNSETTAANYSRVPYRNIAVTSSNIEAIHSRIESGLTQSAGTVRGPSPESELERTIANVWTKLLRRQDISVTDSFFDLGGHSLMAVRLFAELERLTGHKLPLVTLFQAPTIRDLANILEQTRSEKHSGPSLLVPVQPLGNLPPLFLIHGAGGDVLWGYANLAAHLPIDRPVYGIKSRGQIGLDECKTIQEMAAHYVEAVQERQPHGPYYLGGYCFGGNVAYEMARILRDKGEVVELVALLDSSPSNAGYEDVRWWTPTFAWRFARNTMYWLKDFSQMPRVEQIRFITRKARVFMRKIKDAFRKEKRQESFDLEQIIDLGHFPDHELKLWQTHIQALVDHIEQPYDGRVVLFRTRGQPILCSFEEDFCWGRLARQGVQIVRVPGSHENIFMEPNVKVLARELARHLPQAEQRVAEREALAA
jgi:thioesterase domain-containing protein/acyl carrier protein